jgi:Bacterial HORMA domain family 1
MTSTLTRSETESFNIINARKLGAKVATDMYLCAQYYGQPSEADIRNYSEELAQYLNKGYIEEYEFGFKREGNRVVSWRYKIDEAGTLTTDDKAGKIVPYSNVSGAAFFNFLTQNARYFKQDAAEREQFKKTLPFQRTAGSAPGDGLGCWTSDRNYYSGGRGSAPPCARQQTEQQRKQHQPTSRTILLKCPLRGVRPLRARAILMICLLP